MSHSVGRFNLRARKSLKLNGQVECTSCKRYFFPPEYSDIDDENELQLKHICCDCEERQQQQPQAKRRRKNDPAVQTVKQESIDSVPQPHVYYDQYSNQSLQTILPTEKENACTVDKSTSPDCMVQIHSIELLSNSPIVLTNNNPQPVKVNSPMVKGARSKRPLRNKTNTIQPKQEKKTQIATPMTNNDDNLITETDTEDSLRVKFPNITPYEFEFVMFLKSKIVP